jgi:hypothetical protein
MHIFEIAIASPPFFHEVICGDQIIFNNSRIEPHLGAHDGVDEGSDKFEKSIEKKRYVEDKSTAEAFRVVLLEYVQVRTGNAEGRVFGLVAIINEQGDRPGR